MRATPVARKSINQRSGQDDARTAGCDTLVALLRYRAETTPEHVVYTFLPGDGKTEQRVTYRELDRRARSLAVRVLETARPRDRALLLVPPGLDYVAAYFGCLYAGIIAVPAYPPNPRRPDPRIPAIASDCEPTVALTTAALLGKLDQWRGGDERLGALRWIPVDGDAPDASTAWKDGRVDATDIAMLQYTSGSTAAPKGVVLTHRNLLDNLALIRAAFDVRHGSEDVGVFWLPPFHDMGLIGGILQPCYVGRGAVLMSSATFLQRPLSWLEAMSTYRATTSAAPNFAFDLCVERIKPDEMRGLDLSAWHTVFDGAEPIRAETIDRFCRAFADAGFRREVFFPCYGLAEATLFVSGGPWGSGRTPSTCRATRWSTSAPFRRRLGTAFVSYRRERRRADSACESSTRNPGNPATTGASARSGLQATASRAAIGRTKRRRRSPSARRSPARTTRATSALVTLASSTTVSCSSRDVSRI